MDRLLELPQVARLIGFEKTKIYAMINDKQFPRPIKLGRSSRWSEVAVQKWIEDLKSKQDEPQKS